MTTESPSRGFSLVEVVMALGIFAVAVTSILALLPSLTKQSAESVDLLAAQRLPEAVRVELQRLAGSGFDSLAGSIPVMAAPLQNGFALVAARDGLRVNAVATPPANALSQAESYFAVEAWRFSQAPLSYDSAAAVLAVHVRVSWPYYNPGSPTATPLADRSQLTFTVSFNR